MAMPTIATITTKGGRTFEKRVDYHRGDPRNPFTETEYIEKFKANVEGKLKKTTIDRLIEIIFNLEQLSNISGLMNYAVK